MKQATVVIFSSEWMLLFLECEDALL